MNPHALEQMIQTLVQQTVEGISGLLPARLKLAQQALGRAIDIRRIGLTQRFVDRPVRAVTKKR